MVGEFTVTVGNGFTVTTEVTEPVHAPLDALIVYVVVTVGFAVTEEPLVPLKPVAGLHV